MLLSEEKPSKIKSMLVSANQLKTWSKCRKKYQYDYVLKLRWPSDTRNFHLGRTIHKLLDYQSRNLDCKSLIAACTPDIQQCWEILSSHPLLALPVIASEWAFTVPFQDGIWLTGRVDRLVKKDNQLLIIDWKTGTGVPKMPDTDWQTLLYLYGVWEARRQLDVSWSEALPAENLSFVYAEVKASVREVNIPYSIQKHQETGHILHKTLQAIEQETSFPLPEKCPDLFCPYRPICGIEKIS